MRGAVTVRRARAADGPAVLDAVGALLTELRGRPDQRAAQGAADAIGRLVSDPDAGVVVVATDRAGALVGVLGARYQVAIHAGGLYALVQELWVAPGARDAGTGAALVEAVEHAARQRGVTTLEVGLPRPSFASFERTRAFYERCGFEHVGPRMRKELG